MDVSCKNPVNRYKTEPSREMIYVSVKPCSDKDPVLLRFQNDNLISSFTFSHGDFCPSFHINFNQHVANMTITRWSSYVP